MENVTNNNYEKFPLFLKAKLNDMSVVFPRGIQFNYEKFYAYRVIERKDDDFSAVSLDDMRSYYELGKKPRGVCVNENDPELYAVSLSKNIVTLKQNMKFPRPNKKIARGYVFQEGGPQYTNDKTMHVSWWLYENVDLREFILEE